MLIPIDVITRHRLDFRCRVKITSIHEISGSEMLEESSQLSRSTFALELT